MSTNKINSNFDYVDSKLEKVDKKAKNLKYWFLLSYVILFGGLSVTAYLYWKSVLSLL